MKKTACLFLICLFTLNIFPIVTGNWSCLPYDCESTTNTSSGDGKGFRVAPSSLSDYLKNGGTFILTANQHYQGLLTEIERNDYSTNAIYLYLEKATFCLESIRNAQDAYYNLYLSSHNFIPDQSILMMLGNFDYDKFEKSHLPMPSVFSDVKYFLKQGDMPGVYLNYYFNTLKLEHNIQFIVDTLTNGDLPSLNTVWQTNQKFYQSILFGQYISMIFVQL